MNDLELLRSFCDTGSEESFRELVHRHLPMVHSVALRQLRNPDWADEAAHAVFIALARKAASLSDRTILAGWLYQATRFAAGKLLRDESRRARHEKEAAAAFMNERAPEPEVIPCEELAPFVFAALDNLSHKDRDALLLRFVESRSFAEVAAALGATEAAAKMRTTRALEKLRERLDKRGVKLMAATLSSGLAGSPSKDLPARLYTSVSAAALSKGVATATATSLAGSVLSSFIAAKLKIAALVAVILAAGALAALTWFGSSSGESTGLPDKIARRSGWTVDGRDVRTQIHLGQSAVEFDSQPSQGIAWTNGFDFSQGVIEADIAAFSGHVGIAFWVRDSRHFSAVYFRPQNRPEDPVKGNNGVQYVALPDFGWERLRAEQPGKYENPAWLPQPDSGAWFHVRLEVGPTEVRAFIDHATTPCLIVNDFLTTKTAGSVGLFMGTGSSGTFSNLKIQRGLQQ